MGDIKHERVGQASRAVHCYSWTVGAQCQRHGGAWIPVQYSTAPRGFTLHFGCKMTRRGRHRWTFAWRERIKRIRPSPPATSPIRFPAWRVAKKSRVGRPPSVTGWTRNPFFSSHPLLACRFSPSCIKLSSSLVRSPAVERVPLETDGRSPDTEDRSVPYKNKLPGVTEPSSQRGAEATGDRIVARTQTTSVAEARCGE